MIMKQVEAHFQTTLSVMYNLEYQNRHFIVSFCT